MTSPRTANLANEKWTWGVPPNGDYVPATVPGTQLRLTRLQLDATHPSRLSRASAPGAGESANRSPPSRCPAT